MALQDASVMAAEPQFSETPTLTHPAANYNWNIFRYIADLTHLIGIAMLIYTLTIKKSVAALSWKTQVMYLLVYVSRYLDLFDHYQTAYLVFFKVTYIITSACILYSFRAYRHTYEEDKDTVSLMCILVPCFIGACILTKSKEFLEIFWTFSEYLEGFAMVAQYVFCYREDAPTVKFGPLVFICLFGIYRVFYAFNWMYKLMMVSGYRDLQSWLGGMFEIGFFLDFCAFQFWGGKSMLRALVLSVDDRVNETVEKMELSVLPGRKEKIEAKKSEMTEMRKRRVLGQDAYEVVHMHEQL